MATGSEGYAQINQARSQGRTAASRRRGQQIRGGVDRAAQQQVGF
jgi:hypothetical protein